MILMRTHCVPGRVPHSPSTRPTATDRPVHHGRARRACAGLVCAASLPQERSPGQPRSASEPVETTLRKQARRRSASLANPVAKAGTESKVASGAGVSLRDVQIADRHADPAPPCTTTAPARTLDRHPTTSSPPTWFLARSGSDQRLRRDEYSQVRKQRLILKLARLVL